MPNPSRFRPLLALSLPLLVASTGGTLPLAGAVSHVSDSVSAAVFPTDGALTEEALETPPISGDSEVEERVQRHNLALEPFRQSLLPVFEEAYEYYPNLPKGILEAVAYVGSRWTHLAPEPSERSHHHMPPAYGVMGLYAGEGPFRNVLLEAAEALGVSPEHVASDPKTNVLATAALLDRYVAEAGLFRPALEELSGPLARLSGLEFGGSAVERFAVDSQVFDVLLTLDRGFDDLSIHVPERPIDWSSAFDTPTLERLRAPFVRLDIERDLVDAPGFVLEPRSETLAPVLQSRAVVDYPGALWVASPYNYTRGAAISAVTVHTAQGSYGGTINWFKSNPYTVSAHYVIRSSDGQITQMVRESRKAAHVGVHNSYTIGIEHEGFVSSSSWYTTAMYNSSSGLVKNICQDNGIDCGTTYSGPSSSTVQVLSTSVKVKGHQHFSSQSHTDPGVYWDWPRYKNLITGTSGGTTTILDSFEAGEGHFYSTPSYSGSTRGISSSSTAARTSAIRHGGSHSEQIKLVDDSSTSASWQVRFLSGGGSPSNNVSLTRSGGRVGFWIYSGGSGLTAALGVDDSDGTERSISRSIPANTWSYLEWRLDDSAQWNSWVGGNGRLDAPSVTLDAIWFFRAQTSYNVYLYLDDVLYKR